MDWSWLHVSFFLAYVYIYICIYMYIYIYICMYIYMDWSLLHGSFFLALPEIFVTLKRKITNITHKSIHIYVYAGEDYRGDMRVLL